MSFWKLLTASLTSIEIKQKSKSFRKRARQEPGPFFYFKKRGPDVKTSVLVTKLNSSLGEAFAISVFKEFLELLFLFVQIGRFFFDLVDPHLAS
jgi:hypothetical protein